MSSDQLDFVTYCIGNLSMRLQLPQRTIYLKLKESGILENYIIQAKNARIIAILPRNLMTLLIRRWMCFISPLPLR